MNEAMTSFISIVTEVAPYSIFWALGIKAYKFIVGALTGKDVGLN